MIAAQLTHPFPIVRFYADLALAKLLGTPSPLDLHQDNAKIRAAAEVWLRRGGITVKVSGSGTVEHPAATGTDSSE